MDVFDLTLNKDYFVPLTKKEMIEKLEYYKVLAISFEKKMSIENKEYYELLDSLINLEISAFDLNFPFHYVIPNILKDTMMYNVWNKTLDVVNRFNNKEIILSKEPEKHGFVKVYESVIADISLKPPYAFTKPSIGINCYEADYGAAKTKMIELRGKQDRLKHDLRECLLEESYSNRIIDEFEDDSVHVTEEDEEDLCIEYDSSILDKKLEKTLERHIKLNEELEETRKLLTMYRKSLCLYKNSIYKEVAHALLEEYHVKHEGGKDLVKTLPWITISKKSL